MKCRNPIQQHISISLLLQSTPPPPRRDKPLQVTIPSPISDHLSKNTKIFSIKALQLETLINDHLLQATATTVWDWQFFNFFKISSTVEPQYNTPLYNEVLYITEDFLYPNNSKIYDKEPRYNETSL